MTTLPQVTLQPWSTSDLPLLRRLNAPEMTVHLGGPEHEDHLLERHRRYLTPRRWGAPTMFRIVLPPESQPAGAVGYWDKDWRDETVWEMGWGVLPEYQGRGIAVAATLAALARARTERRHRWVHAFPAVAHAASNAVCRRAGFALLGEIDVEYPAGNPFRAHDWRFDLSEEDQDP